MNIDKGLIRHWAWLVESEDERMCEGVRTHDIWHNQFRDDKVDNPPRGMKTIDDLRNGSFFEYDAARDAVAWIRLCISELVNDPNRVGVTEVDFKGGKITISHPKNKLKDVLSDLSEFEYYDYKQLADQFKDKVVISNDRLKAILPGKYSVKSGDVRIELDVDKRLFTDMYSFNNLKHKLKIANRNGDQYTKPNLPKESTSEADDGF